MILYGLLLAAIGASLLLGLGLSAAAIRLAPRFGYVDHPGGHKSHGAVVPYGGGIAIFLASWVPLAILLLVANLLDPAWIADTFGEQARAYAVGLNKRAFAALIIMAGGGALHLLGLFDDVRPLSAGLKLAVIAAIGLAVPLVAEVRIAEFAGPIGATLLTAAWIIVITNTFNFLDNMDGLSAGVACICMGFLIVCGLAAGQVFVPATGCVFLGAMGGFLAFNFPPARLFMGDAGSLLVGYMLAVLSILTTYYESASGAPPYALAMPLVVLAIPLYDFVSVVVIRLREGRNPMKGDQRHFSHRLVERGLSRRLAVLTIYLATAVTGLCATLLPGADLRRTVTIGVIVIMVLAIVAILEMPLRKDRNP